MTYNLQCFRHMNKRSPSVLFSAAIIAVGGVQAQKPHPHRPNIVYILADDLGYGDLGCYGQQKIKTPNIDRLASQGMLFTQHYAGCTVSAPSRCSLMTGYHTGHTQIRGNREYGKEGEYPIAADTYTLGKMLKAEGYATGCFGKWGLGSPGSEGDPNKQGFDAFFGYNSQLLAHNYYPDHLWDNQKELLLPENEGDKRGAYSADLIHEKALQFIRAHRDKPFFAYLAYTLPHAELISPADSILAMYHFDPEKPWKGTDTGPYFRKGGYCTSVTPHADFASMVTRLDAYVGQVMQTLQELGIADNTILIFTSDNGPHQEGGGDPAFFRSWGPLRGIKRDMWEGGIRVPMIVQWPGKVKAGSRTDQVCAFWDVMPTFAEITGASVPRDIDGISFLPTLLGQPGQKQHDYLYWEFHEMGGRIAVRMGNWKGIKLNYGKSPDAPMLVYDLSTDLHEDHDIARDHPEVVRELEELIGKARVKSALFDFGREKQ